MITEIQTTCENEDCQREVTAYREPGGEFVADCDECGTYTTVSPINEG